LEEVAAALQGDEQRAITVGEIAGRLTMLEVGSLFSRERRRR
jgi:hypothetical protein